MSENNEQNTEAPQVSSLSMILTLGGVSILSGLLIVGVFQLTLPRITENKRIALEQAIFEVLPGAVTKQAYAVDGASITPLEEGIKVPTQIYAGYDDAGKLVGVAIEGAAMGYADVIRALYGYSLEKQCAIGMTVLESKETPGLGDKIAKDPDFLANFDGLQMQLNETGNGLTEVVKGKKSGTKENPWEIDGITGATISSVAMGKLINESGQVLVPVLMKERATLEAGGS